MSWLVVGVTGHLPLPPKYERQCRHPTVALVRYDQPEDSNPPETVVGGLVSVGMSKILVPIRVKAWTICRG